MRKFGFKVGISIALASQTPFPWKISGPGSIKVSLKKFGKGLRRQL